MYTEDLGKDGDLRAALHRVIFQVIRSVQPIYSLFGLLEGSTVENVCGMLLLYPYRIYICHGDQMMP